MTKEQKAYDVEEIISVKDFQGMFGALGINDAFLTDSSNIIENGNKAEVALGCVTVDGQNIKKHVVILSQDKNKINKTEDFFKEEGLQP